MEIVLTIVWALSLVVSVLRRRLLLASVGLLAPISLALTRNDAPVSLLVFLLWIGFAGPIVGALLPSRIDLGPLDR